MKFRVIITPDAERDLRKAYRFIRNQGAPLAARKWLDGARKKMKTLASFPERTPLAAEAHAFREPIHELGKGQLGTYRILYTIIDEFVFVLHIRHGSRLPLEPEQ